MKKIISVFIALVLSSLFSVSVFAAPADQPYSNEVSEFIFTPIVKAGEPFTYNLTPGSVVTDGLRMYNNSSSEMSFQFKVEPVSDPADSLAWFSLSADRVTVPANSYQDVAYTVSIPASDALGTKHVVSIGAIAESSAGSKDSKVSGDTLSAKVGVALAYGVHLKVNVYSGEPVVSDVTSSSDSTGIYGFIVDHLNTILLLIVILIMIKVAVDVARKRK